MVKPTNTMFIMPLELFALNLLIPSGEFVDAPISSRSET